MNLLLTDRQVGVPVRPALPESQKRPL